jgi:hypothetical protein
MIGLRRVNAHLIENRCRQVGGGDRLLDQITAVLFRSSVDFPAAYSATGQERGKGVLPMVAAGGLAWQTIITLGAESRAYPFARFQENCKRRRFCHLPPATIPSAVDATNTGPTAHASAEQSTAIVAAVISTASVVCRRWSVIRRIWIVSNRRSVVRGSRWGIVSYSRWRVESRRRRSRCVIRRSVQTLSFGRLRENKNRQPSCYGKCK